MEKDALKYSDIFFKAALNAGFNIPGYNRITSGVSENLKSISKYILSKFHKHPFGTVVPFKYKNIEYGALIEEHAPSATIKTPHPGVSLFIKNAPLSGGSFNPSQRSRSIISGLSPEFQPYVVELLRRGFAAGLRPELVEGYRPQEKQDQLYEQGRTAPGNIVTWTRKSKHTTGKAVDIAFLDDRGNITYNVDSEWYNIMGKIGNQIGLTWGGNFPQKDVPHFQLAK